MQEKLARLKEMWAEATEAPHAVKKTPTETHYVVSGKVEIAKFQKPLRHCPEMVEALENLINDHPCLIECGACSTCIGSAILQNTVEDK